MKGSSYRDRDYAFGEAMLALRVKIGLTQVELAQFLGVSRRAVGDWEAGNSYPKLEHLKQLVGLALQHQAFPAGAEEEKIRVLWHASHQKVLPDEIPQYERHVVIPIRAVHHDTESSVFLNAGSLEAARYPDLDPTDLVPPPVGWLPPYPYHWDEVLFVQVNV